MNPVDMKSVTEITFSEGINDKDPEFKIDDIVRIWTYRNIFAKCYTPNWSEEVFVITKLKNTASWTYVISDVNEK